MHTIVSLSQAHTLLSALALRLVPYATRLALSLSTKNTRVRINLIAHRDCMREMRRVNWHALLAPQRCF